MEILKSYIDTTATLIAICNKEHFVSYSHTAYSPNIQNQQE